MDIETEDFTTKGYIKTRLTVMSFMQFFVWGSWLITIGNYWFGNKHWNATEFGAIFTTMGISSVFMPSLMGMLADKWINTERLYAILHVLSGISLLFLPWAGNPTEFFWVILLAMIFYMPTISLSNAVSYSILSSSNLNVVKSFPPIRVWGTIGFIAAMWFTNLTGNKASVNQFYFAGLASFILAVYALSLPKCPPCKEKGESKSLIQTFGLDAFKLLANYKMLLFFLSSLLLGGALQLTNMYGDTYLDFFKYFPKYADSFSVKYSTIIMSISQVSETIFILAIPFFLSKFGIKKVMLISMIAWVLRFGLLSYGNPTDGLWMIIVSCIVYGMAFDFFNISGSLFVNSNVPKENRASAQGLFMMMTNGFGAILGSSISGILIDKYFTLKFTSIQTLSAYFEAKATDKTIQELLTDNEVLLNGTLKNPVLIKDWSPIWLTFAIYALIVTILFALLFKHKHDPNALIEVSH